MRITSKIVFTVHWQHLTVGQHQVDLVQPVAAISCSSRVCICCTVTMCRETLRRDPVVGAVMRVATRDFQLGGYAVPAGTTFLLPLRYLADHEPRWEGKPGGVTLCDAAQGLW